jgi:hypothetical protein
MKISSCCRWSIMLTNMTNNKAIVRASVCQQIDMQDALLATVTYFILASIIYDIEMNTTKAIRFRRILFDWIWFHMAKQYVDEQEMIEAFLVDVSILFVLSKSNDGTIICWFWKEGTSQWQSFSHYWTSSIIIIIIIIIECSIQWTIHFSCSSNKLGTIDIDVYFKDNRNTVIVDKHYIIYS